MLVSMLWQLTEGQEVTLKSSRGLIRRTIVKLIGDIIVVGSEADYETAKTGAIPRFSVGFRLCDVVDPNTLDGVVSLKHNVQYEQAEHGEAGGNRADDDRGE